jgi:hypothetical protein
MMLSARLRDFDYPDRTTRIQSAAHKNRRQSLARPARAYKFFSIAVPEYAALSLAALLTLLPPAVNSSDWLETIRDLKPYAAISYTYDSNLLRNPPGLDDSSDRYTVLEAGVDTELKINRQRFLVDAKVLPTYYDRFSQFDYTGANARLDWKWIVGDLWEGDLGYSYTRALRGFANQLLPIKDIQNRHRFFGGANRWLTNRWRAGVETDWTDVSFSENKLLDRTTLGLGTKLEYVSAEDNAVGIQVAYANAQYSNVSNRDYEDLSAGPTLDWRPTTKTRIQANIGYESRTYDVLSDRDFSGMVGRVSALWKATGKTRVTFSAYRDLSNLADEVSNYAVIDGVKIEPTWDVTGKTTIRGVAGFERRDFKGADDLVLTDLDLTDRQDDVTLFELWMDWNARRNILFSLGYGSESRDSTRAIWNYDAEFIQARFSIGL